jgi:hypothetical protein
MKKLDGVEHSLLLLAPAIVEVALDRARERNSGLGFIKQSIEDIT